MKRLPVCVVIGGALAFLVWAFSSRDFSGNSPAFTNSTAANSAALAESVRRPQDVPGPQTAGIQPAVPVAASPPERDQPGAAFDDFSKWAGQFLTNRSSASTTQGEALAWKRREAMLRLIETDPERAIELASPFRWRTELPPNVTRYLEQWVDGRGDFSVAIATDFDRRKATECRYVEIGGQNYQAFVYGSWSRKVSRKDIPLHGLVLGGKMAVLAGALRFLEPEEARLFDKAPVTTQRTCAVCSHSIEDGQGLAADAGGDVLYFCCRKHADLASGQLALAQSGGGSGGSAGTLASIEDDLWTHGIKTILYIRLNFPDDLSEPISEAEAYGVMNSVNSFYTENSYDQTSLMPTVTPLLTLPRTKAWYSTAGPSALLSDGREAARQGGYDTANYDLDIVAFTAVPGFDWAGLGAVHGKGNWLQSHGTVVTAHELGHNYGLWHANFWDTTNNGSSIGPGTNVEYGNIFDVMGSGSGHFNAQFKNNLGWLPAPAVTEITASGTYMLYGFDVPDRVNGRFYAAKVTKDFQRDYWIEFRQGSSLLQPGLSLNWSPWSETSGSGLLDTTPGTPTADGASLADSSIAVGSTFSDPAAGIHITTLEAGGSGSDAWMSFQVNLGAFPGNRPPEEPAIESDRPNGAPNEPVYFLAAAFDPDGDALAYRWSFDNVSAGDNSEWTGRTWSTPGDHVVRCVLSDMKGGVASVNQIFTVGQRTGCRITGQVLDTEGFPVEGVRVDNGTNSPSSYIGGYTDSDGRYVIVGVTGDVTLNAVKYGFAFTNYTDPLTVTNDLTLDFLAAPLPVVTVVAATNRVPETFGFTQHTITRTGNTDTNLIVFVHVSGTATLVEDYVLYSENGASNHVEFPPGVSTVTVDLQTHHDTTVEGDETATLSLVDDPAYLIGSVGAATVTIVDDDAPARPSVSVAAITPTIPENGKDSGVFKFSRTGDTQGDLQVFYIVSGTATPGTDYSTLAGVVIIPAGSSSATVQFQPWDDKDVELDETVGVSISSNPAYTGGGSAQVTIVNDDLLTVTVFPTLAGAAEPSSTGQFTVKRDGDLSGNLVVGYSVSGSATSGADFVPLSGSVTIPAGKTSADIVLSPLDDALVEGDESVVITLRTNTGFSIGTPGSAALLIRDDEKATIVVSAPDDLASEAGDDFGTIVISRGSVVNGDLAVNLAISGTAIPGADYVPLDNPVIIPNGASSVSLDVIAFHDLILESNETVIVTLLPGANYSFDKPGRAVVEITDDGLSWTPGVGFSASASSAVESRSPGVSVSLSVTSMFPITVDYRVIGGTASNNDYVLPPGTLTFEPGEWAKSIPMPIVNDTLIEPDETIRLVVFNPTNATLDGIKIHTYTILDDDTAAVSVTTTVSNALETGPVAGNFRIIRTGATNADLAVHYQITGTAGAPADYAPLGNSVTIPAGMSFVDLPVVPVNDQTVEHTETVVITLLRAAGASIISPYRATVTISDDDVHGTAVVALSVAGDALEGGGSGGFFFTRSGSTAGPLTVEYSVGGSATPSSDYAALPGVITIPAGQASVVLPVTPVDDTAIEGDETVVLHLTILETYRVAYPATATVTILDNDQRVAVYATDFSASEPGANRGEFTITRFGTVNGAVQVFFTISGTATGGVDYQALPGSAVIPSGARSVKVPVVPWDDELVEGPETVVLTVSSNPAYSLGQPVTATVTLMDDEPMLRITAAVSNVVEGSPSPGVFRLIRTGDPQRDVTAHLAVGGTAISGMDYPPLLTNIYFSCSVTSVDLLVFPTNELVVEGNETVVATLLADPAYTILPPDSAAITIEDAGINQTPLVTISSPTVGTVFLPGTNVNMILEAAVTDDGDTNITPLVLAWTKVSGPDTLAFGDTNAANTTVSFTNVGVYLLRLMADDGQLQSHAEVTAVVGPVEFFATNLLHWPLDEGGGTNVLDLSGAGRDGALVGAPLWTTNGVQGGALRLNGTNDCIRQTGGSNCLNGLRAFTLSLWVNSAVTNAEQGIFCADDSGASPTLSLATRTYASCGQQTNVVEATVASSRGVARYISAGGVATNGWQHLLFAWSNGLAPVLFINGQLDQPLSHRVPLKGILTNCPQFIVGKSPLTTASWNGWVDDVRVFPRILSIAEMAALAALPPANYAPVVEAGSNVTVQLFLPLPLEGEVADDGKPVPPGTVTSTWNAVSGPIEVALTNALNPTNIVFYQAGEYVLRLIADDSQVKVFDDLAVTAIEPTRVDIWASDSEAAELGPDPGQFTLVRDGEAGFDLTVHLAVGGFASNGVDFVTLPNLKAVTLPSGFNWVTLDVIPFLDHRIEGDEPLTLTIVSNLAYSIGLGEATVIIHDSPYGVWSVEHFTLEELTDPTVSSEAADFDHDGLLNFVEYALNRDPRASETNSPVRVTIEEYPGTGRHITLTYTRRLPPTDTAYAVYVSNDLRTWNTGAGCVEEVEATDDGNGLTETVKARVVAPYSTSTNTFVTVRVWLEATGP